MFSFGVLAALASAFFHPLVAAMAKKAAHPLTLNFLGICVASLVFSFVYFDITFWERVYVNWEQVLVTSILHTFYVITGLLLISRHEFQVLYPLTRLAPIFILIAEVFLLSVDFSIIQIVSIVGVVLGALVLGLDHKISQVRVYVFFSLLMVTLSVAIFHIIDKQLLTIFTPSEMWAMILFQVPMMSFVVFLHPKALKADFLNWRLVLGFSFCMIATWYLALIALRELDAAVMASIRNMSILFGVFLGGHLFNEGHRWWRYGAAILICGGVLGLVIFN